MKRTHILSIIIVLVSCFSVRAQVTIGSDLKAEKGAILDLKTKNADQNNTTSDNGGMILPRIKLTDLSKLNPVIGDDVPMERKGLIVYNIATNPTLNIFPGIYEWDGSKWQPVANTTELKQPWYDVDTKEPATSKEMDSYVTGNTVIGGKTISSLNTKNDPAKLSVINGDVNLNGITLGQGTISAKDGVAIGSQALSQAQTSAKENVAIGNTALSATTTGVGNIAVGNSTLSKNTSGSNNIAIGTNAGSNLTTGSNNIYLGYNNTALSTNATSNNIINIGNLIYGTQGNSLSSLGTIGINTNTPLANLHVGGDMRINPNSVPLIRGFAPLVIGSNCKVGTSMLLPIYTLNSVIQSSIGRRFSGKATGNPGSTVISGEIGELDKGNSIYLNFMSSTSEIVSNTLITPQALGSLQSGSLRIEEDVLAEISGYIFFQIGYLFYPNVDDPFIDYTTSNKNNVSMTLYLEYTPANTSERQILTTGNQIWYGANAATTIKIIQLQPIIKQFKKGDKLQWYIKKTANSIRLNQMDSGDNITKSSGGKYSQGLFILGLSE